MGMNSTGAKLNTVSLSLAGTESADMINAAYECSVSALHTLYEPPPNGPKLCDDTNCGFCSMLKSIDSHIIQLSLVEGGLQYRTGWDESVSAIDMSGELGMTFTSKLKVWHSADNRMPLPRSVCGGIIMPSKHSIANLENKEFTPSDSGAVARSCRSCQAAIPKYDG